jgi:hypothetical protein
MKTSCLIILGLILASFAGAQWLSVVGAGGPQIFYVDQVSGNDSNLGTINSPWKTLSKVNGSHFNTGSQVLLKKGDTWRELLTVPGNGIAFNAYGSGSNPIISGADLYTGWSASTGTPETCTGACLELADAETNDTSQFSSVATNNGSTFVASSGSALHGTYGFINSTTSSAGTNYDSYGVKTISGQSTVYARFYIRVNSSGFSLGSGVLSWVFGFVDSGANYRATIMVRNNGGSYSLYGRNYFGTFTNTALATITLDTTYEVEVLFVASATVGGYQVWVNGSSVYSNIGSFSTSGISITTARLGAQTFAATGGGTFNQDITGTAYFDDFKISSTGPIGVWAGTPPGPANSYQHTQTTFPYVVLEDGSALTNENTSLAALTAGHWFYDGSSLLYVITNDGSAPSGHTMEVGNRQFCVNMNRKTSVTVSNITYAGVNNGGVNTPSNNTDAWGDSLTYGIGTHGISPSWPDKLATSTGRTVYNGGVSGYTSTQIATAFTTRHQYDNLAIIWSGRNNYSSPDTVISDVSGMLNNLPTPRRCIIMSVLNGNYPNVEWSGDTAYNTIVALNVSLASVANTYGCGFIDIRALQIANSLWNIAEDVIDKGHGVPPSTSRAADVFGTINGAITDPAATTFTLAGVGTIGGGVGLGDGGTITLDSEKIFPLSLSGNNVLDCTRGYAGTTAATHLNGASWTALDTIHQSDTGNDFIAAQIAAWIAAHDR